MIIKIYFMLAYFQFLHLIFEYWAFILIILELFLPNLYSHLVKVKQIHSKSTKIMYQLL